MRHSNPIDFLAILRVLCAHLVDFIVVGGVSAVLQGAPINTFDLDIVHSRDESNIARLLDALNELDAIYRAQPERQLRPAASHLASRGHQLLMTRFGPLDVLGTIGNSREYASLLPSCIEALLDTGMPIRILDLAVLVEVKSEVGAPKDTAVLPILQQTLEERRRR